MLGLDPDGVIARIKQAGRPVVLPDLKQSLTVGALGFTIVSVLMFGLWAVAGRWLHHQLGELLFYSLLGVGFMAGGGAAFKPILIGANLGRFYALYAGSFVIYAAVWILCWFTVRDIGEWLASFLGPALMGMLFAWAFGASNQMGRCVLALVIGHTAGYFVGSWLFAWAPLQNRFGMLIWGVTYGAGFGAGISYSLSICQEATRKRLLAMCSDQPCVKPPGASETGNG